MRAQGAEVWGREGRLGVILFVGMVLSPGLMRGQQAGAAAGGTNQSNVAPYQGSVVTVQAVPGVRPLSLDQAVQMGLRYNLGLVLAGEDTRAARAERLQALQALLPTLNATAKESVQQTNLKAEGLNIPGFPSVIGPYAYTDLRASGQLSVLNLSSLQNYLAAKHNFEGSSLSEQDARDMVVLTVGNAYLLCIADASRIETAQAELATAKVSLDQANDNHQAGTAPLLDVLRARVDYQTEQQSLIVAQNQYEKDKLALARSIGLPLEQQFELTDQLPFVVLDNLDPAAAVEQALANRADLKALEQQVQGAKEARSAAGAERYPTVAASGDYGDIGRTLGHSHGTFDAVGSASVPVFEEAKLRGDAAAAQSQLDQRQAQLSDLRGQIGADVRDSILDIRAAEQQVRAAQSNVSLAKEALSEAQLRYAAGVSDNLAVSQAQAAVAQADEQYISSLYQHNLAKLSLARALGITQTSYKNYLGGK